MSTIVRPRRRCPSGLGQLSTRKKSGVQLQGKPAAEPTSVASTLSESSPGRSLWPRAASSRVGAKGGCGDVWTGRHARKRSTKHDSPSSPGRRLQEREKWSSMYRQFRCPFDHRSGTRGTSHAWRAAATLRSSSSGLGCRSGRMSTPRRPDA